MIVWLADLSGKNHYDALSEHYEFPCTSCKSDFDYKFGTNSSIDELNTNVTKVVGKSDCCTARSQHIMLMVDWQLNDFKMEFIF